MVHYFMKINAEGDEEFVLKRERPFLMIEVHSPEIGKKILAILQNLFSSVIVFETGQS